MRCLPACKQGATERCWLHIETSVFFGHPAIERGASCAYLPIEVGYRPSLAVPRFFNPGPGPGIGRLAGERLRAFGPERSSWEPGLLAWRVENLVLSRAMPIRPYPCVSRESQRNFCGCFGFPFSVGPLWHCCAMGYKDRTRPISVRLHPRTLALLRETAAARGVGLSDVMRAALGMYFTARGLDPSLCGRVGPVSSMTGGSDD